MLRYCFVSLSLSLVILLIMSSWNGFRTEWWFSCSLSHVHGLFGLTSTVALCCDELPRNKWHHVENTQRLQWSIHWRFTIRYQITSPTFTQNTTLCHWLLFGSQHFGTFSNELKWVVLERIELEILNRTYITNCVCVCVSVLVLR